MHELSLCGSIADVVKRHAGERQVDRIHLRIGALRQVVPDTLEYCWTMVSEGTDLAGSVLDVERVPATITCRSCGQTMELGAYPILLCLQCDGTDVDVVTGEEFLVTSLEIVKA